MKEIEKKAAALLKRCETVILSSVTEEGNAQALCGLQAQGTGIPDNLRSHGIERPQNSPISEEPAGWRLFFLDGDSVTMTGSVTVHTSGKTLRDCWQDWMLEHF